MKVAVKKLVHFTGHSGPIYSMATAAPGLFFSAGGDQKIIQWNLAEMDAGVPIAQVPAAIYALCYVAELKLLLVGTATGSIHIIDLEKKQEIKILKHHSAPVFDITYSSHSQLIFTASADGNISICSLKNLSVNQIRNICTGKVRSIDFNLSGMEVAIAAADGNIRIIDVEMRKEKASFRAHELSANVVKYHPNGKHLVSGGRDAHLRVWDAENDFRLLTSVPAHNFAIYSLAFSPDAQFLATASRDKTIKLWDSRNLDFLLRINKENYEGHLYSVNKLLWTTYENYLISAGDDRSVMVWSVTDNTKDVTTKDF